MSYVEFGCGGLLQHVIYIHLHGRSYLLLEHPVYQPLISSSRILDPKRHYTIAISSLPGDERGLFLVIWIHADLVVVGEGIHETEEFMAGCGIYDEVDSRQRETILWVCSVDVSEAMPSRPRNSYYALYLFYVKSFLFISFSYDFSYTFFSFLFSMSCLYHFIVIYT